MPYAQIILASASPRRRELLDQIGVSYQVKQQAIDETALINESASDYVLRVAAAKSQVFENTLTPVLSADTAVVFGNIIMGKPKNLEDALMMLMQLSGKTHQVYSGVSLRSPHKLLSHQQQLSITEVTFKTLTETDICRYWQTGEPKDKAGAYAIQGLGALFVESIQGSFSGVVGLPLFETAKMLSAIDVQLGL